MNDSKALKEALIKAGFLEEDIYMRITGGSLREMPTKEKIERNLAELFAKVGPSDLIFIAFSGHGVQIGEEAWFCPPFVNPQNIEGSCVSIGKMMEDLATCKAKFKWVVVDACRNDPTSSEEGKGFGERGLQAVQTPPEGILLFQSCAPGEESLEDRDTMRGYFTKNLVAAISGEADVNQDGDLTLMEICSWTISQTRKQVKSETKKSQCPYISGKTSDFIFTHNLDIRKAKALAAEGRTLIKQGKYAHRFNQIKRGGFRGGFHG